LCFFLPFRGQFRKRFAGVAAGATEAVAPFSLRSVLLRSASSNAMGAFVLSTVSSKTIQTAHSKPSM
jgi:hypothetical protein